MNQRNDKPETKENGYSKEREGNGVTETCVEPRHLNVLCGLGLRIMQIFTINKNEINISDITSKSNPIHIAFNLPSEVSSCILNIKDQSGKIVFNKLVHFAFNLSCIAATG